MKNLIIFLVLLISTPIFSFAQKQLQKGEDGTFRLKPEIATDYHNTNLTVSICAEEYLEYIPDLLMLGKGDTLIVNMDTIKKFVGMVGFWKYKESSFYSQGITLVGNEVECTGPCFKDSEIRTAWFVILMVISVVLMILSDILGKEFFAKHSFLFAFSPFLFTPLMSLSLLLLFLLLSPQPSSSAPLLLNYTTGNVLLFLV